MPRGCKSVAQSGGRRMNARFNPEEFVKERNEALFSLDEKKIKAYMKKYCVPEPHSERIFLGNGLQGYMQYSRCTARS